VLTHVFLFLVAIVGGALNAVAGGGSFFTLPALIYSGVAPVVANATSTLAMWPAALASGFAYRREMQAVRQQLWALGAISLVGGFLGGKLLTGTSDSVFVVLLPWLMLAAVTTFAFGGRVTELVRRRSGPSKDTAGTEPLKPARAAAEKRMSIWMLLLQLAIATYGGYFGGGMGIMMLAVMAIGGMTRIHEMNALKTLLALSINGVALATFILDGAIAWRPGLVMVAGGMTGGYVGASLARRVDAASIRRFVIVVGSAMTVYFFVRGAGR
jgi:uncharacterized membrane protein YfcA